jgi:tetratricopeptide (TPR) repeat protein
VNRQERRAAGANPVVLFDQAQALHRAGRLEEAKAAYAAVVKLAPRNAEALRLLGAVWAQLGQPARAAPLIEKAVRIDPNNVGAQFTLGAVLKDQGRPHEALAAFDRAIALNPRFFEAHGNRGLALDQMRQREEALAAYDQALALEPRYIPAISNKALALHALGRDEAALAACERALSLDPRFVPAWLNRCLVLLGLNRNEAALVSAERALALDPGLADAHNNRAGALIALQRPTDALASVDRALALDPRSPQAHYNRGLVLLQLMRQDEAILSFEAALAIDPDFVEAAWTRSTTLLLLGRYAEGWPAFEVRKQLNPDRYPGGQGHSWRGEPLAGRRLFVQAEQGLGDTLQFARFLPMLEAMGASLTIAAHPALKGLVGRLAPRAVLLDPGERAETDEHVALMSLPLALGATLETLAAPERYLAADPERVAAFEALLGPRTRPRVGLAWSGNPDHRNDRFRSIAFERLTPLLSPGFDWVAVQNAVRPGDQAAFDAAGVRFLGEHLADFDDTAALVEALDLVISVDTSTAHLAGALGRPVWVLLAHSPDWRWMLKRTDSAWYPSARLFRQPKAGDWESVISVVRVALAAELGG